MAGITAKMIAEELGISPAAVSIALNGRPGVSEATRKEVIAAAEKMGFNPQKLSALKSSRKKLCFVFYINRIVSIAENTTFSSFVLKGAEAAASALGYSIFVRYIRTGEPFTEQLSSQLADTDGIILLGTDITAESYGEIRAFLERIASKPVVIIDNSETFGIADCVCNDNLGGAAQAAQYLIDRGCTRIGYLRAKHRMENFRLREAGVRSVLKNAGLTLDTVVDTEVSFDEAYSSIDSYLSAVSVLPDGFFADNDVIAAAALRALNAHGIAVPQRVSVIGYDDIAICELTAPSLSTVHSFKEQLGKAAVDLLAVKFNSENSDSAGRGCVTASISTKLHIRNSVK